MTLKWYFYAKSTHTEINKSELESQFYFPLTAGEIWASSFASEPQCDHLQSRQNGCRGTRCRRLRSVWHSAGLLWLWDELIPSPPAWHRWLRTPRPFQVLGRLGRVSGKLCPREVWFPSALVLVLNFSGKVPWCAGKYLHFCCFKILVKVMFWNSHFKQQVKMVDRVTRL